ncbi:MAG: TIGR03936 family radical SAM-associated protein [Anaerolineae bacterium]
MRTLVIQRLRIIYGIADALSYASVLDIGRLWERLLHRSQMPLAYTQGFNPHPRLQFAAALAVGYTSSYEVLDLLLSEMVDLDTTLDKLRAQCPSGLTILRVEQVPLDDPSPQATLRQMSYQLEILSDASTDEFLRSIAGLLAQTSYIYQRLRKGQTKPFDLRPLLLDIRYVDKRSGLHIIEMDLLFKAEGSVRPEEIISALALPIERLAVHRSALLWGEGQKEGSA